MAAFDPDIVVVSGLPRSGTSLMMQMLDRGGVEIVTDNIRSADTDNPRGYYEYEPVKKIKQDRSWLPSARGKAFKMVSQLLYDLPPTETYRIVFMERDLDETLDSQEKMLKRLGQTAAPREKIKAAFTTHLTNLHAWLGGQENIRVLRVGYAELIARAEGPARLVSEFLGGGCDVPSMLATVDPSLYRNRKAAST